MWFFAFTTWRIYGSVRNHATFSNLLKSFFMSNYYNYQPARLVKGVRWYIEFYQTNPITKTRDRVREYCNMGHIKDISERQNWAVRYINELNTKLLPNG